jgi:hypothetical protein
MMATSFVFLPEKLAYFFVNAMYITVILVVYLLLKFKAS